ncbi:MAG: sulfurtransferase-like selenium metabolism protein YedF [Fusobacteriaceae bacterium]
MIKLDAIGKTCPLPIIMLKNALKDIPVGEVELLVDNEISVQNIEKFCKELGYQYSFQKKDGIFSFHITKKMMETKVPTSESVLAVSDDSYCVVVDSDEMGKGDSALGKTLIKGFIYTLTEMENLPKAIIFYNKGVFLATEGCETEEDLKKLQSMGVEILSCGACVNFYNLTDKVKVGIITNMYNIINTQTKYGKVIKP